MASAATPGVVSEFGVSPVPTATMTERVTTSNGSVAYVTPLCGELMRKVEAGNERLSKTPYKVIEYHEGSTGKVDSVTVLYR